MSASGEVESPTAAAVEQPPAEVAAVEQPAEKPVKEKKTKAPKEKKPKTASHPPYFQMIKEALLALNEKEGSSPYAIAKYMEEKHKAVLPPNFRKTLGLQLKNSASKGKLTKVKASYKLSESGKKDKVTTTTKSESDAAKKPKQGKAKATKAVPKKPEAVKKKTKKMTPAKPKQPKSIKSPAAKKPKKAVAST